MQTPNPYDLCNSKKCQAQKAFEAAEKAIAEEDLTSSAKSGYTINKKQTNNK
jgi:hypothetical protein